MKHDASGIVLGSRVRQNARMGTVRRRDTSTFPGAEPVLLFVQWDGCPEVDPEGVEPLVLTLVPPCPEELELLTAEGRHSGIAPCVLGHGHPGTLHTAHFAETSGDWRTVAFVKGARYTPATRALEQGRPGKKRKQVLPQ